MAARASLNLARTSFTHETTINWFPGHMAKGIKQMRDQMRTVDLIVETRDARIPLSSINMEFERLVGSKDRLVVYNKADLAPPEIQHTVQEEMAKRKQRAIFTDTSINKSVGQILSVAVDIAQRDPVKYPQFSIMVVGMPNVGKSSLINALRRTGINRGKAASTGAKPGVTRAVSSKIRVLEKPAVYLLDTPGVMMPHIPDPMTAIKVALTGNYWQALGIERPTDDINELVDMLARKIGALRHGGETDTDKALQFFLRTYRQGRFGRFCLDDLDAQSVEAYFKSCLLEAPLSKNQGQKAKRAAQRQRSLERARSKNLV
ncbi:Mitochondrial GTPase 1 [Coemansia sp. BCRC 34301]|nr:Mitochondrial GTPase 1 [Coemansia sp. BCRC 34301]